MSTLKERQRLRSLLNSEDPDHINQAIELALTLEEADLLDEALGRVAVKKTYRSQGWATGLQIYNLPREAQGEAHALGLRLLAAAPRTSDRARRILGELSRLKLPDDPERVDLRGLDALRGLEAIWAPRRAGRGAALRPVVGLSSLSSLPELASIRLEHVAIEAAELPPTALESLTLERSSLDSLQPGRGTSAAEIELRACALPAALRADLRRTRSLTITDAPALASLEGSLPALERLAIEGCPALRALPALDSAPGLLGASLKGAAALSDLSPLAGKPLEALSLEGCAALASLGPLAGAAGLASLDLRGCAGLSSLEPLGAMPGLRVVALRGTRFAPDDLPPALRAVCTWAESPLMDEMAKRPSIAERAA